MEKTLVTIIGPTGIGKTEVSLRLAKHFGSEIVSADSRQFYREMSIGTAVPSQVQLSEIPHHFIHHLSIHDYYNASLFEQDALICIDNLFKSNDIVILAGGSMMYVDAVCKGIDPVPDVDPEIRNCLSARLADEGIESLRMELRKLDPIYYSETDLKNPKRIIHALEVCLTTGRPFSSFRTGKVAERSFRIIKIGLNCERELLFERIDKRVDEMIANGLAEEARSLLPFRNKNPLNTVGYRELFDFFDGTTDLQEAIRLIKRNTRRYARKQLTWFLRDNEINWFYYNQVQQVTEFIKTKMNE